MGTNIISKKTDTFDVIKSAVNKLVDTVKPTFGPASNKVIIDKIPYRMIVDDGVQIARDFQLNDPMEDAVVKFVRETAVKTNDRVGDGTTGALLILQGIINEVSRRSKVEGHKVEKELKKGLGELKEQLKAMSATVETKEDLKKVAMVSFDDEAVAEMIADLYFKLGEDGIITLDKSPSMETVMEMTEGVKINKGYISPYMITNPDRMEALIEKPYILITDYRLTEAKDILPIMEKMVTANRKELIVIAENVEQSALSTMVINKLQGQFLTIAITTPAVENRKVFLEDLAKMTGAKMFTESKGDKLENAEVSDLGRAQRFICRREESIIVEPKADPAELELVTAALRVAIKAEQNENARKTLEKRLGMYTGTLAVIKVGAPTENEQKSLKYKVEDAVHSVKAAFKSGVVCGGGLALRNIKTSSSILNKALLLPSEQLFDNMDMEVPELAENEAMNVVTGERGNYLAVGVVDPTDVLIAGIESAVSIASILVTSSGMIVETRDDPK